MPTRSAVKLVMVKPTRMAVMALSRSWPRDSGGAISSPARNLARRLCRTVSTGTSGEFITSTLFSIAAAIENDLRGIDVHDGDVAAENLADSNGLKDSLNLEVFATHRRVQGQRIADLQRVAIGKRAGKQDGIGPRKKDERVGDFGLRFIELV